MTLHGALGFAVTGGRSLRMGRDKALLPWGDTTLLGHALVRLRAATLAEPRVLCGPTRRYEDLGLKVEPDAVPEGGALVGLLAGLRRLDAAFGLFLAVDLPLVPVSLLRRLLLLAEGFDAVVPLSPAGREPLCAVYGPGCLAAVEQRVAAADFKMTSFWPEVRVREVQPAELADLGDVARWFRNVNEPADYEAALRESGVTRR